MPAPRWSPGDTIVLRFVGHDDGIAQGWPQIVVEDSEAHLVLFQPAGVTIENRRFTDVNLRAAAIPLGQLGNLGIDTTDNRLDLVMAPDLVWARKDVEQLAAAVASGLTYEWESALFHAEAERLIAAIESRAHPFNGSWAAWRPDPAGPHPVLPDGWHRVAGVEIDLNRARPVGEGT